MASDTFGAFIAQNAGGTRPQPASWSGVSRA